MFRDRIGAHVTRFAGAVAEKAPEVGAVIHVEHHLAAVRLGDADRLLLRGGRFLARKMRAGDDDGCGRGDEAFVDIVLRQRHVGAVVAIEDQRKGILVAHAENHEGGQALPVGDDAFRRDALALHLLADEAAHGLVADAGDEARFQAEPRGADGDIRRAAADRLGEGGHVLQPPAHLLAVEIDRGASDGDDIQGWLHAIPPAPGLVEPCEGRFRLLQL